MRTKEIEIGTITDWLKVNEEVADTIIEKHNDINVDYDSWYDYTIENFLERANKIGFEISYDDVQFSGFYSQGDGASFTSSIDILRYLKATKQLTVYRPLVRAINCGYIEDSVGISRDSHHYSHENTCSLMGIEVYEDITTRVGSLLSDLETELEEKRKELSLELYSDLDKANDDLRSRESVISTLVANEYEFDESGEIA